MEDFVPFETAKKLKEKGFREECLYCYRDKDGKLYANLYLDDSEIYITTNELLYSHNSNVASRVDAPTISQVLKWLREEKNILLAPNPACFKEDCCLSWDCDVWAYGNYNHCCVDYKTYEKASIAGIEYVLDNLI